MKAADVMTTKVVSVGPDASVTRVAKLMLDKRISAVPVVDAKARIVGIVSEGDLLRRKETGTERQRSWWLELLASNWDLANDYVKSHARKVRDVMTRNVVTVSADTPVNEIADILESRGIKRVPVTKRGKLVGIVSRANLIQALAAHSARAAPRAKTDDLTIRETLLGELQAQKWAAPTRANIVVKNRVIHLWGPVLSEKERQAIVVAAENVAGVRAIKDHLFIMPVYSGT